MDSLGQAAGIACDGSECEWYNIASARETPYEGGSLATGSSTPRAADPAHIASGPRLASQLLGISAEVGRCLEETTAGLRQRPPALPAGLCAGFRCSSLTSSISTAGEPSESCTGSVKAELSGVGSEAATGTTPTTQCHFQPLWEKRVSLVDEKQAEMFNLQWNFVREHMQAFSEEIAKLRDEFQGLLVTVVSDEVEKRIREPAEAIKQVKLDLDHEAASRSSGDQRIERIANDLKHSLMEEMRDFHDILRARGDGFNSKLPTDRFGEVQTNDMHSLNVSLTSEESPRKVRTAAAQSAELAAKTSEVFDQLQSVQQALERESNARASGDKDNATLISQTSQELQRALAQERQERQCMCSLLAMKSQERVPVAKAEKNEEDIALHETLRGLFASVGSLQEALSREAELRVSGCEEVQKRLRDEAQCLWAAFSSHAHDLQIESAAVRAASGSPRRVRQGAQAPTDSSRARQTAAAAAIQHARRVSGRSHTPSRFSRSSSVASLPQSSRSHKADAELLELRTSGPRMVDLDNSAVNDTGMCTSAGQSPASSKLV